MSANAAAPARAAPIPSAKRSPLFGPDDGFEDDIEDFFGIGFAGGGGDPQGSLEVVGRSREICQRGGRQRRGSAAIAMIAAVAATALWPDTYAANDGVTKVGIWYGTQSTAGTQPTPAVLM